MTLQIDINILHENYNYRPINSILDFKISFLQDLKRNLKVLFLKENRKLPETRYIKTTQAWDLGRSSNGVQTAAPAATSA